MSLVPEREQPVSLNKTPTVSRRRFLGSLMRLGLGMGLASVGLAEIAHENWVMGQINEAAVAAYPRILSAEEEARISGQNRIAAMACNCSVVSTPEYKNNPQFRADFERLLKDSDNAFKRMKMISQLRETAGVGDSALLSPSVRGTFGILVGTYLSISGLFRLLRKPTILSSPCTGTLDTVHHSFLL